MNISGTDSLTILVLQMIIGTAFAISMPVLLFAGMRSSYKKKLAKKEGIDLPYDFSFGAEIEVWIVSIFGALLGIGLVSASVIVMINTQLTEDQILPLALCMTALVSTPTFLLIVLLGRKSAEASLLQHKIGRLLNR